MSIPKLGSIGALIRQAASGPYWELLASLVGVSPPVLSQTNVQGALEALATPAPDYSTQATWFIDFDAGNDSNSGLIPTEALKTNRELTSRIGAADLAQDTVCTWLSDQPAGEAFVHRGTLIGDVQLAVVGTPTILETVVLTGVTNISVGTSPAIATVAGFDWTPYVGRRVVVSGGTTPIGTTAWIERVVPGDVTSAQLSNPALLPSTFFRTLAIGDTLDILQLPDPAAISLIGNVDGTNRSVVSPYRYDSLRITRITLQVGPSYSSQPRGTVGVLVSVANGCDLDVRTFVGTTVSCNSCKFGNPALSFTAGPAKQLVLNGCSVQANLELQGVNLTLRQGCSTRRIRCSANYGPPSHLIVEQSLMVWEWPSGPAILIGVSSSCVTDARVWGSSLIAGSFAIRVDSTASYSFTTLPELVGQSILLNVRVGGVDAFYAGIGAGISNANNSATLCVETS